MTPKRWLLFLTSLLPLSSCAGEIVTHPDSSREDVVELHVFLDTSSVEVFGEDGLAVISDRIFPDQEAKGLSLYQRGGNGRLINLEIWPLHTIWEEQAQR